MLFDLRGRGRRRAVKAIYLSLALLLGGGLVLFGIGGDVQGGLFDAFKQGSGSARDQIQERRDKAVERTKTQPNNASVWARVAEAEYQLAGQSDGYNNQTGEFTGASRRHLEAAKRAWERHLRLAGEKPDANLAGTMRNALTALGDNSGAVRAQEVVIDNLPDPGFGDYAQLSVLAYQAGQARKGDLASKKALDLAPKDQREALKAQLDQAKMQASGAGQAGGATPQVTTVPSTGGS
jgi:hypothetical protein